jgi:hypothetical protein
MRRNVGILQWEQTETKCDLQDYLQALTCVDWVPIRDQVFVHRLHISIINLEM